MNSPPCTRRMKNSYSSRRSAEEEIDIGRWMSLPAGPMRPSVAYWPGLNGNGSSSASTPTIASPSAISSQRLSRPVYG